MNLYAYALDGIINHKVGPSHNIGNLLISYKNSYLLTLGYFANIVIVYLLLKFISNKINIITCAIISFVLMFLILKETIYIDYIYDSVYGFLFISLFMYLSYATAAFSILLMIKAKPVKALSCVYFAVNTILLIGPGAVQFTLETGFRPNTYIETLVFYIVAIALSAIICIQLCTNANIDTFYTTNIAAERRKAAAAAKAKQNARPRQVKKRK